MSNQFRNGPAPMRPDNQYSNQKPRPQQQWASNQNQNANSNNGQQRPSISRNPVSNIHDSPKQDDDNDRKFMSIKSHGKKTAIGMTPDLTQKNWYTIRLEGAAKLNDNSKAYDWKSKVSIQITKQELPVIIGVLLGFLPSADYGNHGDTNKGFTIENQGKNFFFKVREAATKKMMVCPVPTVEAHLMGMMGLSEYVKNFQGMSCDAALSAIKTMCGHMVKNDSYPKPKSYNAQ